MCSGGSATQEAQFKQTEGEPFGIFGRHAAVLEDEDSAEEAVAAVEAAIESIERACSGLSARRAEVGGSTLT